jgi:mycothiol synthase
LNIKHKEDNLMKQLMMFWREQPLKPADLPEGYSVRTYKEGDEPGWIAACTHGLDTGSWTIEDFRKKMLELPGLHPEGIFFVIDPEGKIAGTASGVFKSPDDLGYVHMVSIHPDYRGLGLSKPLNAAVMEYLVNKGRKRAILDTDDFRVAAIKVYLWLGFLPILHDVDMEGRWLKVMELLGLKELGTYTAEGESSKVLKRNIV